ncbi:MAG: hypothetical protein HOD92_07740 [Deltaproteobacteria bacterium]|jgi:hypothetical protein|nr:hypothetical protein [Deltaproteobacteria bacterium]MBT4526073.1 hypothetical protein [Deltaproteobacteria bacterium]
MSKKQKSKKNKTPKKRFSTSFIVIGIITLIVGFWGLSELYSGYQQTQLAKKSEHSGVYRGVSGLHLAKFEQSNYRFRESKKILDPMRYKMQKQMISYGVAGKIPQVLDQIYCFCGCSHSIGHKSLLSCFTDDHAANCGICMDQALLADKMTSKGSSIVEIVDAMDLQFN